MNDSTLRDREYSYTPSTVSTATSAGSSGLRVLLSPHRHRNRRAPYFVAPERNDRARRNIHCHGCSYGEGASVRIGMMLTYLVALTV